jgi:TetR/AcrR family transcriptional regulator, regulator of cefoperazone and chloramphenicol sensitivity
MSTNPMTIKSKGDEARQRLIEVAGQIFAEEGYEAATVRQITDRAQVNVAAVNYYFGDKFQLYRAVLQSITGRTLDRLKQHCMEGSAEERLRNFIRCILVISSSETPKWAHLLMAREHVELHNDKTEVFVEAIRPIHEIATSIVTDLLEREADPTTVRFAAGMVITICVNRIPQQRIEQKLFSGTDFREEGMEETVELLYRFLLAGIQGVFSRKSTPQADIQTQNIH